MSNKRLRKNERWEGVANKITSIGTLRSIQRWTKGNLNCILALLRRGRYCIGSWVIHPIWSRYFLSARMRAVRRTVYVVQCITPSKTSQCQRGRGILQRHWLYSIRVISEFGKIPDLQSMKDFHLQMTLTCQPSLIYPSHTFHFSCLSNQSHCPVSSYQKWDGRYWTNHFHFSCLSNQSHRPVISYQRWEGRY